MKIRHMLMAVLAMVLLGTYLSDLFAEGTLPGSVNIRSSLKGTTAAGSMTSTAVDANTQALDVSVKGTPSVNASQTGTWTVQPGNTANTTAWLVTGTGGTFPASQSGVWTVQPGNTANTTAWKVDGSAVTQPTSIAALTSVVTGQQAVTATAAALPANAGKSVCVQALSGNGIDVFIGPSTVTTANGWPLTPGSADCLPLDNSNRLYVIGSAAGSSVAFRVLN